MIAALTGIGLSAAAGLNAWIPVLVVALLARFTDLLTLPGEYAWVESWWTIGVATVLLLVEVIFDKVPVVDHLNDLLGTVVRPTIGALITLTTTAARDLDNSTFMTEHPWIPLLLGAVVAGLTHGAKAVSRPVLNAATGGAGAPVASTIEDGAAVTFSVFAILLPIMILVFFALLLIAVVWWVLRGNQGKPMIPK